ncbi:DUF3667 domain-containing protein [Danxiaibacter flavus]|uniref:DUF3667 domain-containing protein n=1 Tax=Danxiaibacter flavus TaxID=3049108 RepID=A0ABV3Z8D9_9BACT|nr:DUF3667 domain-containing protein [Chitinophagaceae bacterium DXS]
MSHFKERKEKICLNCNTEVVGRYCHVCGQENIEPKESAWHLITHFVNDITHFDGKFFSSLKYLISKPGFLSSEYLKGRRVSYLHPIRMYVFTSFIFFLIVFLDTGDHNVKDPALIKQEYAQEKDSLMNVLKQEKDTARQKKTLSKLDRLNRKIITLHEMGQIRNYEGIDTSGFAKAAAENADVVFTVNDRDYRSLEQYDSVQKQLPAKERDGWFMRQVAKRGMGINKKFQHNSEEFVEKFKEKFLHSIPKMMFVSLPLVALLLQLLYIRRKEFFYVSHGIFVIHVYIAIFILILVTYLFSWLGDVSGWSIFGWLTAITVIGMFYYLYKAMRNFYQQGRGKTVLKFGLFNLMVFVVFMLLASVFVVNSLLSI